MGLFSGSSQAQLLVVTSDAEPRAIAHAELAYADGDGPAVTWLALRHSRGPLTVVAALPKRAQAEPALDAWFAALEACSSPGVLPPQNTPACSATASYVSVAWARTRGAPAQELELETADDVAAALDEQGLSIPSELPEADHYAVWSWAAPDSDETTRTLRILGAERPLSLLPSVAFPLLVTGITRGPKQMSSELGNIELGVELAGTDSDYHERVDDWLRVHDEPLLETRSRAVLFDWSILGNSVSLPPLADGYARAAARELPELDAEECAAQLRKLRRPNSESGTSCGAALDLSLALAAAGAEQASLQRWITSGDRGFRPAELLDGGEPRPPILRARSFDDAGCVTEPPPPVVIEPPPTSGAPSGRGSTTTVVEQTTVVEAAPASDVSCGSSPRPDPYYDDRDTVTCGSDTSSDAGRDDDCSADSSSSSADSGCGSDTSSSSADSGCDGGSEDHSYDGDTCTGSAAPRAEDRQKTQAGLTTRPRRLKTSLWTLAFAAVALPIRRRKRAKI